MEKYFKLSEYPETDIKTEAIAGITTFFTMAYVLATIPSMLNVGGLDRGATLTSMIFLIILTSFAMGIFTNRPFALAPGLGSVAIVAGMISNEGIDPAIAAGVIFVSGAIFVLISFIGLREAVVKAIPVSLKQAVSAGIGIFIALIGAKGAGLIVATEVKNSLTFGQLNTPSVLLAVIGFAIILILRSLNVKGYLILAILAATIIGIPLGLTTIPSSIVALPSSMGSRFLNIDIISALNFKYIPFVIALFIPDFFSTFGTVIGVGTQAGYLDEDGNLPGIDKCFQVDALATVAGSLFGMPSMTTYLESSAGVEAGGRTGLTVIFTGICFIFALFFAPIALMIPKAATSPALVFIGVNMMNSLRLINYDDFTEAFPAFMCVVFTIFGNNIANGICVAIPVYIILKLASKRSNEIQPLMYVLVLVCGLYFYTLI